jgi:hypothetical protein
MRSLCKVAAPILNPASPDFPDPDHLVTPLWAFRRACDLFNSLSTIFGFCFAIRAISKR